MSSAKQLETSTTAEDLQFIKWAGWSIVGVVFLGWAGWVSLLSIGTQTAVVQQAERENNHFEQLRADIQDVKQEVISLRKPGAALSVSHQ